MKQKQARKKRNKPQPKASDKELKDRLLQTRITPSLYEQVVERAAALRIPVSNLIRIILEDSPRLFTGVVDEGMNIAQALGSEDGARRQRQRRETAPPLVGQQAESLPKAALAGTSDALALQVRTGERPAAAYARPQRRLASSQTVPSAPANAKTAIGDRPKSVQLNPQTTAIIAPRPAPLDMPNIYGSAKGLRKRAWKTTPLHARAAPTIAPSRIRGTRTRTNIS